MTVKCQRLHRETYYLRIVLRRSNYESKGCHTKSREIRYLKFTKDSRTPSLSLFFFSLNFPTDGCWHIVRSIFDRNCPIIINKEFEYNVIFCTSMIKFRPPNSTSLPYLLSLVSIFPKPLFTPLPPPIFSELKIGDFLGLCVAFLRAIPFDRVRGGGLPGKCFDTPPPSFYDSEMPKTVDRWDSLPMSDCIFFSDPPIL